MDHPYTRNCSKKVESEYFSISCGTSCVLFIRLYFSASCESCVVGLEIVYEMPKQIQIMKGSVQVLE